MNKTVLLALTIIITSMAGGCSFLGNAKKDFDESTSKPLPKVKSTAAPVETAETEEEEELAESEEDTEATQKIAGLIPTTDAETRVRNIVRGRQDPFSVVSLVPKIEIEEAEIDLPRPSNIRNDRERTRQSRDTDSNDKPLSLIDEFRTELAQKVVISGLYESNGSTKIIVQAPEEDNSRYVEVGQYLSNGQVLVKRIDPYHFPTPLVILEQSGVEIAKEIGETATDGKSRVGSLPLDQSGNRTIVSGVSLNTEDIR